MNENARKTILLVEDEAIIALAEKKALEMYGYAVMTASSGEKALTLLAGSTQIDLVLMDINLGAGMDGTQTAEIILKDRDIPIIFLSSHSTRDVVEKTEKITSYGYVVKNSSITVLDASIKMAFKLFDEKEKSKLVTGKLEATLDALPDVLFEVGLDGLYFHVHSSKSDMLLKPVPELVGMKIRDILPPEVAVLHMSAISEAHEKGYSLGKQYMLSVPAGEKWFEISVSRMTSHVAEPHFMILRRDITDRMKAEEKYRKLLMHLDSGIVVHRVDTSIIMNNDRASELLGLSSDQMRGKTAIDPAWRFISEDKIALPHCEYPVNRVISAKGPIRNQVLGVCRPSTEDVVWLLVNGFPLLDDHGAISEILISFTDITDRKNAEEQIMRHNAYLQAIIETTADGFWVVDEAKNILQVNDAYCRMSGYSRDELLHMRINDLEADENPVETENRIHRIIKNGYEIFETKHRRKDGSALSVEISTSFLDTDGGQFVCFCRDISERKKIEEALQESEERLQFVLQASGLGYWDWNFKTNHIQRNERWAEMLGYTKADIENGIEPWLKLQHPEDRESAWQSIQDHLEGRTDSYSMKYRLRTKDGRYKWIHDSGKIMKRDAEGNPVRLCGTHVDISDQVEAEQKIKRLLAEKELILKEVHHRIKNNLATMSSLLSLHAESLVESSASTALKSAGMRLKSMALLYDRLFRSVDFSHLSIRSYLPSLIDDIVATFPGSGKIRVEKQIEEFLLDTKRMQVLGIIINELITNIMKYAFIGKTEGLISVTATSSDSTISISITDNGNGMPDSVDFSNTTGFGLQLVHTLTLQLEGMIRIERGDVSESGTKVVLEFGR